jgi:hypothetical protein
MRAGTAKSSAEGVDMLRAEHERQAIIDHWKSQSSPDENVTHAEKIATAFIHPIFQVFPYR